MCYFSCRKEVCGQSWLAWWFRRVSCGGGSATCSFHFQGRFVIQEVSQNPSYQTGEDGGRKTATSRMSHTVLWLMKLHYLDFRLLVTRTVSQRGQMFSFSHMAICLANNWKSLTKKLRRKWIFQVISCPFRTTGNLGLKFISTEWLKRCLLVIVLKFI